FNQLTRTTDLRRRNHVRVQPSRRASDRATLKRVRTPHARPSVLKEPRGKTSCADSNRNRSARPQSRGLLACTYGPTEPAAPARRFFGRRTPTPRRYRMDVLFLLGRILFAALFILSGINHLTKVAALGQYAASEKVPAPRAAVVLGGLVILLVPTSFAMHNFWAVTDPMQRQVEMAMFLKNLALTGAALMTYYFTAAHPDAWVSSLGR